MNHLLYRAMEKSSEQCEQYLQEYFNELAKDFVFSDKLLPFTENLFKAMEYSIFSGGKRIRPFLTMTFCTLFEGNVKDSFSYACALEMIHTYSLIHDDLPCMDNDTLRRGKPCSHILFGQATALLAGDTLLTDAFSVLCKNSLSDRQNIEALKIISYAAGSRGMAVGQQIDLSCEEKSLLDKNEVNIDILKILQQKKTGALFEAACVLGVLSAGFYQNSKQALIAKQYAEHIGLAFQITDDILDVVGDTTLTGKQKGSDDKRGKMTYVSLFTLEGAYKKAEQEILSAKNALSNIDLQSDSKELLLSLADYILERKS